MQRLLCLPLALALTIIAPQLASAQPNSATLQPLPIRQAMRLRPIQPTCQNKRDSLTGNVTAVQGDRITVQSDRGASQSIVLPAASGGQFTNLVGQRVIVNRVICYPEQMIPAPPVPQKW
jgi:hypothetical protein